MKVNNILSLYVPAGCTDWMQECDVVVNAPFKRAIRDAFRDHLYQEFDDFVANPGNDANHWVPNLNVGHLKPYIPGWNACALHALKAPSMKQTIIQAFSGPGCIGEARRRTQNEQLELLQIQELIQQVMVEEERSNAIEEVGLVDEIEFANDAGN